MLDDIGLDDLGLGTAALVVLPLLVAIAVTGSRLAGLGHDRGLVTAALRAIAQLAVVGLLIGLALRSIAGALVFVLVMLVVAIVTSARRIGRAVQVPGLLMRCALAIAVPSAAALQLVVLVGLLATEAMSILAITELLARAALPDGRTVTA